MMCDPFVLYDPYICVICAIAGNHRLILGHARGRRWRWSDPWTLTQNGAGKSTTILRFSSDNQAFEKKTIVAYTLERQSVHHIGYFIRHDVDLPGNDENDSQPNQLFSVYIEPR
jgi:hypothetical protein